MSRDAQDPHRDVTGALHEVSNALTVLLGWVAQARAAASAGRTEALDRAIGIVEERARTARDLARRAIGAPGPVDDRDEALDAVVDAVIESLAVEAQRAGVRVQIARRCAGVVLPLASDAAQVLSNLILNAIAWSPRGSRVTVEADADTTRATVAVKDEGPGVEDARAERIFEGSTTREGGAGVGLRHARAVARAAGGDLELVRSESGDGDRASGACFRLAWPRVEPTLVRKPPSLPRQAVLAGTRVLVVEDDLDVATLLETALGARGARVVVARSAAELSRDATGPHDAALVDLSPIARDVRGAIDALRKSSPEVALVVISGSAVGLPEELEGIAGIRWVRKPFEIAEVLAAISETRATAARGSSPPPPVVTRET